MIKVSKFFLLFINSIIIELVIKVKINDLVVGVRIKSIIFGFCRTYCLAVVELNLENRIFGRIDKLHLNVTLVENMNNNSKMRPTGIKSNQIKSMS